MIGLVCCRYMPPQSSIWGEQEKIRLPTMQWALPPSNGIRQIATTCLIDYHDAWAWGWWSRIWSNFLMIKDIISLPDDQGYNITSWWSRIWCHFPIFKDMSRLADWGKNSLDFFSSVCFMKVNINHSANYIVYVLRCSFVWYQWLLLFYSSSLVWLWLDIKASMRG